MPCPAEQLEVINTFVFELEPFLALGGNASVASLASLSSRWLSVQSRAVGNDYTGLPEPKPPRTGAPGGRALGQLKNIKDTLITPLWVIKAQRSFALRFPYYGDMLCLSQLHAWQEVRSPQGTLQMEAGHLSR